MMNVAGPESEVSPAEDKRRAARKRRTAQSAYTSDDFDHMAKALGVGVEAVQACREKIESAARWFDSDVIAPERASPSQLAPRLERIAYAARKLLKHLGVKKIEEAPDGPPDGDLLAYLAGAVKEVADGDHAVTIATGRIGRLVEILEAIEAAKEFERRAFQAADDALRVGGLIVPKGHVGDVPVNNWIATMLSIYKEITGREPGTSVGALSGKVGGPLVRFLAAAGQPLGIKMSSHSWRNRVKTLKPRAKSKRKKGARSKK